MGLSWPDWLIGEAADNSCIPCILELVTFLFLPWVDARGTNKREGLCLYIGSGVMKTCSTYLYLVDFWRSMNDASLCSNTKSRMRCWRASWCYATQVELTQQLSLWGLQRELNGVLTQLCQLLIQVCYLLSFTLMVFYNQPRGCRFNSSFLVPPLLPESFPVSFSSMFLSNIFNFFPIIPNIPDQTSYHPIYTCHGQNG